MLASYEIGWRATVLLGVFFFLVPLGPLIVLPEHGDANSVPTEVGSRSGAQRWLFEKVSDLHLQGDHVMMLDSSDRPHIVFISEGIRYAVWNGDEWEVEAVPGGESPYPDRSIAADIDGSGYPHIVYCTENGRTNHTWKDGSTWHSITVIEGESAYPRIVMDGAGNAHIAFFSIFPGQLIYANCSIRNISTQVIGRGDLYGLSMVLDRSGKVLISATNATYMWAASNRLELYRSSASGWTKETIPQGNGTYHYTSLALGNDDKPYISFTRGYPKQGLIMLGRESERWLPQIVLENLSSSRFSFVLGRDGREHFISDENYTVLSSKGKSSSIIDIPGFTLSRGCLAVDQFGYVHISSQIGDEGDSGIGHITYSMENERPLAKVRSIGHVELGSTIILDGSSSRDNDALEMYNWTVDLWVGGEWVRTSFLEGMVPEVGAFELGTLKVVLRVMDASGNWDEDRIEIEVKDTTPPVANAGEDVTVIQNTRVTFNGSGSYDLSGKLTFRWFIPPNMGSNMATFTKRFIEAGTFIVNLTVTDPSNNQGNDSLVVTVLDTTKPGIPQFDDIELTKGRTLSLNASSCSDNVGIVSYIWSIKGSGYNKTLEGMTNRTRLTKLGEYNVTLTIKDLAGNSNSTSFVIKCVKKRMSDDTKFEIIVFGTISLVLTCSIVSMVLWTRASIKRPPQMPIYSSNSDDHFGTGIYIEVPLKKVPAVWERIRSSFDTGGSALNFTISPMIFFITIFIIIILALGIPLFAFMTLLVGEDLLESILLGFLIFSLIVILVWFASTPVWIYIFLKGLKIKGQFKVQVRDEGVGIISRMDNEFPILFLMLPYDMIKEVRPISTSEWRRDLRMSNPFRAISREPKKGASLRFMDGMRRRDIVTIQLKRPVIATQYILLDNMAGRGRASVITGIELIVRLATKTVFSVLERKETVEKFFVCIPPKRYEEFMTSLTRAIEDSKSDILPTQQTL